MDGAITGATNITLSGELDAATGDFSGDVDVDGTLEADAYTLGGSAFIKLAGTNFTNSLLIGHATTGTLNAAQNNVGVGAGALDAITSGDHNTAVGADALSSLQDGIRNIGLGYYAGNAITSGQHNIAIGHAALATVTSGIRNLAVGYQAGNKTTGNYNTHIGYQAGYETLGGEYNINLGWTAGNNITTGSGNVVIGVADVSSATGDDQLSISDGEDGSVAWITGDSSGNLTFAADVTVGDDLNLTTDSTVINFGADSDTTLTHTDGTGLTLNSTNKICFNDASQFIQGSSATVLSLGATDEIDLTATAIDINGTCDISGTFSLAGTNVTATAAEINLIDGGTARGTTAVADGDGLLVNDAGTMRMTNVTTLKTYFQTGISSAADDISAGDSAVSITTSSGDITIDAAANNSDIIFKGTDATSDITMLTLDGSEAGAATFNDKVVATELDISGNCDIDGTTNLDAVDIDGAVQLDATLTIGANDQGYDVILYGDTASANVTWDTSADDLIFNGAAGLIVPDGQLTLGSTAVSSTAAELNLLDGVSGLVQADLTKLAAVDSTAAELNIVDGGTSATSTTVADADRVVLNDNGTMVQVAMTDIKTYIGGGTSWQAVKTGDFTASAGQGVFCNTTSAAFTLTLPASPSIGDEVSFVDYAGTFDSNNLTIGRNSEKIHGATENLTVATERAANTLVYTDSTQGWLLKSK